MTGKRILWGLAMLLTCMGKSWGQTVHYVSFTPRSFNPNFWLFYEDSRVAINAYFNPYPAVGYGFIKGNVNISANFWYEYPVFSKDRYSAAQGIGAIWLNRYEIRSGRKIFVEVEGAYIINLKKWLFANLGITMMFLMSNYVANVSSYRYQNKVPKYLPFRQKVTYWGMPIRTGITMFPIKKLALGLSIDLLWHIIYKISYAEMVPLYYTTQPPDRDPLKPYIPEIRLRLHVVFLKTDGNKTKPKTYSN